MPYYYNLIGTNTTNQAIPMTIQRELQTNIVPSGKISDYHMTVIRASISNAATPLMDLDLPPFQPLIIYMSYAGFSASQTLVYDSNITGKTDGTIDQFQQFIDMLNNTFEQVWVELGSYVSLPSITAPFLTYDSTKQLMSYYAGASYLTDNPNTILVAVNYQLSELLQGFQMFKTTIPVLNVPAWQLVVSDTGTNYDTVNSLYVMTQTSFAFTSICSVNLISIQTTLPVQTELYSDNTELPVVLDFTPAFNMASFRNTIVYESLVPYRKYKVQGHVQYIAFTVYWTDWSGYQQNIMMLAPGQSFNIKLMFTEAK